MQKQRHPFMPDCPDCYTDEFGLHWCPWHHAEFLTDEELRNAAVAMRRQAEYERERIHLHPVHEAMCCSRERQADFYEAVWEVRKL